MLPENKALWLQIRQNDCKDVFIAYTKKISSHVHAALSIKRMTNESSVYLKRVSQY